MEIQTKDEVLETFESDNLIIRAMEAPNITRDSGKLYYDCSIWTTEFELMKQNKFSSVSSTLLVPNVGVSTYKNVGFLVDARMVDVFHISKTDSLSNGNMLDGDFNAGDKDFNTTSELATYIKENNATEMNELNINLDLNGVIGLVVTKCPIEVELIRKMLFVIKALEHVTGITYPLYEYEKANGKITKIELTEELVSDLIAYESRYPIYNTSDYLFYSEDSIEPFYGTITDFNKIEKGL